MSNTEITNQDSDMVEVHKPELRIKEIKVNWSSLVVSCPQCGETLDGFLSDPRGTISSCEYCGADFWINKKAKIVI